MWTLCLFLLPSSSQLFTFSKLLFLTCLFWFISIFILFLFIYLFILQKQPTSPPISTNLNACMHRRMSMKILESWMKQKSMCSCRTEREAGQSRRRQNKAELKVMNGELNQLLSLINYPVSNTLLKQQTTRAIVHACSTRMRNKSLSSAPWQKLGIDSIMHMKSPHWDGDRGVVLACSLASLA